MSLRTGGSLRTRWPCLALRPRGTCGAGRPGRAVGAVCAGRTGAAAVTLRALGAGRSRRPVLAGKTTLALSSLKALGLDRAGLPGVALRSGRACGASGTSRPGATRRALHVPAERELVARGALVQVVHDPDRPEHPCTAPEHPCTAPEHPCTAPEHPCTAPHLTHLSHLPHPVHLVLERPCRTPRRDAALFVLAQSPPAPLRTVRETLHVLGHAPLRPPARGPAGREVAADHGPDRHRARAWHRRQ